MPYIPDDRRAEMKVGIAPETAGELTYCIYRDCKAFLATKPNRYITLAMVIGAIECAKQELYRQVVAPYENGKKEEHGDV